MSVKEEIASRAHSFYEREIRDHVMPGQKGKFLVLDVDSGDYEVNDNDLAAEEILESRRPNGTLFGLRVGYTTAYTLAGTLIEESL